MKRFICSLLTFTCFTLAFSQESAVVDSSILGSDAAPNYVEFTGSYSDGAISSRDQIRAIGQSLGARMEAEKSEATPGPVGLGEKYSASRTYGRDKPGADIFYIAENAGVEQIKPLRLMLAGYIENAFAITREESESIAEAVCNWNTNNYNNKEYFSRFYDEASLAPFSDKTQSIGLSKDYREWPNSRILIPHKAAGSATISVSSVEKALELQGNQELQEPLEDVEPKVSEPLEQENKCCNCFPCWHCILLLLIILLLLVLLLLLYLKYRKQKSELEELKNQLSKANSTKSESETEVEPRAREASDSEPRASGTSATKPSEYDGSKAEVQLLEKIKKQNPGHEILLDGSYPGYYKQNVKILFVGKNANGIDGAEYSEAMIKAYKAHAIKSKNGTMTPSAHIVHRRSLKYVYGIEHNLPYKAIPKANDLADIVGNDDGFSFARINVFKNTDESQVEDPSLLQEQIAILKCDIAIGMKLDEEALKQLGSLQKEAKSGTSTLYTVTDASGRKYKLINTGIYFSDPKGGDAILYEEIRRLYKRIV